MTLKLNELRIGNWIQFMDEPPQQLTAYTMASLCKNPKALEFYKPIAITEEWLLKIKFSPKESIVPKLFVKDNIIIHGKGGFYDFYYGENHRLGIAEATSLKFVHQLQNLYSALTYEQL